jgi:uncharacterized phiE125 gp8 family phage protein
MTLRQITAATTQCVTLDEVKAHLRLDEGYQDGLLQAMIYAATEAVEHATGRVLMTEIWEHSLDAFPTAIQLTRAPIQAITSISYVDLAGATQTVSPAAYALSQDDFGTARIHPVFDTNWPEARGDVDGVKVTYSAGYADAAGVPQSIKQWMLLQVASMFENREAETMAARVTPNKLGFVDALLNRYRVWA